MTLLMVVSTDSEILSQKNAHACKVENDVCDTFYDSPSSVIRFIVLYPVRDIPFRVIHSYSNPSQAGREL